MDTIERIRSFLSTNTRRVIDDQNLRRAGVLVLLFPKVNGLHVLLTKRTEDVEHHKGQISFPGGAIDREDADIVATALREADEEIGLARTDVEILGLFDDHWTPSGFCITPVVGFCRRLPPLRPNPVEVEEILEVPVSLFLDRQNERIEYRRRGEKEFPVYYFTYSGRTIWGATAAMMRSIVRSVFATASEDDAK